MTNVSHFSAFRASRLDETLKKLQNAILSSSFGASRRMDRLPCRMHRPLFLTTVTHFWPLRARNVCGNVCGFVCFSVCSVCFCVFLRCSSVFVCVVCVASAFLCVAGVFLCALCVFCVCCMCVCVCVCVRVCVVCACVLHVLCVCVWCVLSCCSLAAALPPRPYTFTLPTNTHLVTRAPLYLT